MCQGFSYFPALLCHFVLAKLAISIISVKLVNLIVKLLNATLILEKDLGEHST